jgi:hypothetical protein
MAVNPLYTVVVKKLKMKNQTENDTRTGCLDKCFFFSSLVDSISVPEFQHSWLRHPSFQFLTVIAQNGIYMTLINSHIKRVIFTPMVIYDAFPGCVDEMSGK